jgi:hypothetical protein
VRLAKRNQRNAKFAASLDLAFGLFAGANQWRCPAAAARQARQRLERRARAAEMVEQCAKGARADILTADEAEPIEPLLTGFVLPNYLVKSVRYRKLLTHPCCIMLPFVLVYFRAFTGPPRNQRQFHATQMRHETSKIRRHP